MIKDYEMQELKEKAKKQGGFQKVSKDEVIIINNHKNTKNLSDVTKETVLLRGSSGHGSGFIIDSSHGWLVITNNHVVSYDEYITIVHYDGNEEYGYIIRKDDIVDTAIISFPNKNKRNGVTIRTTLPEVGDEVFAIGSPLEETYSHSVSKGIISAINRVINDRVYIQSDVSINPGNSGGPLVLKSSEVIGVAVSGLATESGDTTLGINHFIPVQELIKSLNIKINKEK